MTNRLAGPGQHPFNRGNGKKVFGKNAIDQGVQHLGPDQGYRAGRGCRPVAGRGKKLSPWPGSWGNMRKFGGHKSRTGPGPFQLGAL